MQRLFEVGPLRLGLCVLVITLIATAPYADGKVYMHDWRLFPSVIAPTLVTMILFVLPLDITMSWIFKSSSGCSTERQRLATAIKLDFAMLTILVLAWLPFTLKLLN